jgi:porin
MFALLTFYIANMKSKVLYICLLIFSAGKISAQNDTISGKSPISFEAAYTGDIVSNFSGGIKKGTSYLGLANFKISIDTKAAHLWEGGQLFINAANTHGVILPPIW